MSAPPPTRILLRNDTLSNWENPSNPGKLNKGEIGIAFGTNNKVIAKVGTDDGQTWAQAKPLSVEADEIVGVNIENVGRVILEGYENFDGGVLEFSECIESFTLDRAGKQINEFPEWSQIPNIILDPFGTKPIDVVLSHINILNIGSDGLYGYRTNPLQREYGLVHPSLFNDFKQETINNDPSFSNSFPVRPIPSEESYLMFLREIEVWELPRIDGDVIRYIGKVDAWVPNKPETYTSNECNFQSPCLTQLGYCCYDNSGNLTSGFDFVPGSGGGGGGSTCSIVCACPDGSCPQGGPSGPCIPGGGNGGGGGEETGRVLTYLPNVGFDISDSGQSVPASLDTEDDGTFIRIASEAASINNNYQMFGGTQSISIDGTVFYPSFPINTPQHFVDVTIKLVHNHFWENNRCTMDGPGNCANQPAAVWPKVRARIRNYGTSQTNSILVYAYMRKILNSPPCPPLEICDNAQLGDPGGPSCFCDTPNDSQSSCGLPDSLICPPRAFTPGPCGTVNSCPPFPTYQPWPMTTTQFNSDFEEWRFLPATTAFFEWTSNGGLFGSGSFGPGSFQACKDYVLRRWEDDNPQDAGICELRLVIMSIIANTSFDVEIDKVEVTNNPDDNLTLTSILDDTDIDPKDYGIQKITFFDRIDYVPLINYDSGTDDITTDDTTDITFDLPFRTFPTTIVSRIRYQEPKPLFIQGFPKFIEGFVVFDKTRQNIQTTNIINGGTYDSV
jgi:hypothetical protein